MQFNHDQDQHSFTIHAYGSDHVDIVVPLVPGESELEQKAVERRSRTERLTNSFIMSPAELIRDWEPRTLDELNSVHFDIVLNLSPEVVILGTGTKLTFPDMALMSSFMEKGIGFEVMDTAAACRTYNILMSEGRRVVTAILQ